MSDTIYKKFAAAWESVENPPLDSVNPGFKNSKYASLGAVLKVIRKACKGIVYMQVWETHKRNDTEDTLTIDTWVMDTEGNRIDLSKLATPIESNPQKQGGIITYYRRYVACTDWGIVGEEDDDGNIASGKTPAPKPKKDELADLWQQCIDLGVKPDGLTSWYEANGFKGRKLTQLNNAERMKVKAYLTDMRHSIESV